MEQQLYTEIAPEVPETEDALDLGTLEDFLAKNPEVTEEDEKLTEGVFEANEVFQLAKNDPDFLSGLAMPEVFEYGWPPVFLSIWAWLTGIVVKTRDFSRLAVGLPRGFGKTTMVKLFILYCILFTKKQFILILSNNQGLANNIISDVADMLNEPNIKAVFGDWNLGLETDTLALKKFGFRGRNIVIAGLGAGGSVRGLNIKHARPDVIVFEDVQSREDADSQVISDSLFRWMLGTAMKAKSPKGCLFLFIANMYPTPHSILKKLKANKTWQKFIAGGLLMDPETGELESLWEELQPKEQLLDEFSADLEAGRPEIFFAEVMNDENASVNTAINVNKIPSFPYDDTDVHSGNFVIIDPATDKANADLVSVGYFQVHDAKAVAWEIVEDHLSPGNTIREALKYCFKYNCSLIVVEGNAYQSTLCYWFKIIMEQMGIQGIQVVEIYSGRFSKNSRILTMFKELTAGETYLHPRTKAQVYDQIRAFDPLKTNNVDGILDLLTYAPRVLTEFAEYLNTGTIIEQQMMEIQKALEYTELDNSAF